MRAVGRPGRGERARVAARVRDLVGEHEPTARTTSEPRWLPDPDLDEHLPRHGTSEPQTPLDPAPTARGGPSTRSGGTAPQHARWDPGRRGAAAIGLVVVVVLAATGWWLASSRPKQVPVSVSAPISTAASGAASAGSLAPMSSTAVTGSAPVVTGSAPASELVVDVAGKVLRPGIYRLPSGARVFDAVRAAGGVRRGVSTVALNLAAPLQDGEQVVVGVNGVSSVGAGGGVVATAAGAGAQSSGSTAPVDLNTATLEQLETLPGIGPALGQRILDWRSAHGTFGSVDQLNDVSGIGDVRMAQLRPLVTV